MRQMSGKKRVVMTGISSLLVAGLVVGNIEYATHTYRYDSKVQAMAANNKVVEQTASFASSKKKSTVSKEETVYATLDANGGVTDVIVSDWLKNSGAEAVEFLVKEECEVTGKPLMELKLKKDLLVSCIFRNGEIIMPSGNDCIMVGDAVLIVTAHTGLGDLQDILA